MMISHAFDSTPAHPPVQVFSEQEFPADVGAVVIGGDYQGLGIVRSLGRRGIPVCVIDDEFSIARFSKYTARWIRVPDLRNEESTIATLLDIAQKLNLRGWVLYPTRDETVAAIANHRDQLAQWLRVPTPNSSTIQWAWDKRKTYELAESLSIPAPATWHVRDVDDLSHLDLPFPIAIKPAIKEHFFYATKAKAWSASNLAQLKDCFARASALMPAAEVLLQDFIPGDGTHQFAYCGFIKDGQSIAKVVVRRRRQHPAQFGRASTYVESIELPQLEIYSERFLRAINYSGLVEMEYKFDPRDGLYKLLDVNARTWGYHTLGEAAGVDFSFLLFADQTGSSVEKCRGRAGIKWIRMTTDFPASILEILRRRLKLGNYLESLRNTHLDAVFSTNDPIPGLVELALLPYLFFRRGF